MRLVVTIPTYNEKENVEEIVKKVLDQSKNIADFDLHVLVSDSHSLDGTAEKVLRIAKDNARVHYLDVKERGLGIGLIYGHRYAIDRLKADVCAQMDGDLSHDPATLPTMLEYIKKGYDLVNGSRLMPGGKNLLGWHRRLFTRGSALYCKLAWGTFNISEYTTSYRVFTKKLFEKIDLSQVPWRAKTYIIQPSFLYAAISAGAKIKEVPITFEDRRRGYSKAKIIAYTLDVLRFGIRVRFQKSKILIKFLMVGGSSYLLSSTVLGLLNRGEIYLIPFLSKYPIQIASNPLLFQIPAESPRLFVASVISIELAIIYNFIFHENWTFKTRSHKGPTIMRLLKFNLTSIASPLVQIFSIHTFANILHLHEQIGLAVGVVAGLSVNYIINLLWIWKALPPQSKLQAPSTKFQTKSSDQHHDIR